MDRETSIALALIDAKLDLLLNRIAARPWNPEGDASMDGVQDEYQGIPPVVSPMLTDGLRDQAKDCLKSLGWKPGDTLTTHSVIELMVLFGAYVQIQGLEK